MYDVGLQDLLIWSEKDLHRRASSNCHYRARRTSDHQMDFNCPTWSLHRDPQTVFSVCRPWKSPLWLAALLLRSGDVEANPGPITKPTKTQSQQSTSTNTWICNICHTPITPNQYSFKCNIPMLPHWVHKKCTQTLIKDHSQTWICPLHLQTSDTLNFNQTDYSLNTITTTNSHQTIPTSTIISLPSHFSATEQVSTSQISHNKRKIDIQTKPVITSLQSKSINSNSINPIMHNQITSKQSRSPSTDTNHVKPTTTKKENRNIKILQLNINGIKSKLLELKQLLEEENIDIAVIQETKLHPSSKNPTIPNYSFYRQDRPMSSSSIKTKINGGGLIMYIKNNLPYTNTATYTIPDIESQSITIPITSSKNLIITNLYIPQRNTVTNQQTEDANITTLFTRLTNIPNSLIAGDINAHSNLWYSPTSDHRGEVVATILQGSDHIILNQNTHTRTPSQNTQQLTSPDITSISSNLVKQTTWKTKTSLASDHLPIIININTKTNFRLAPSDKTFSNYRKAKWENFTNK